MKTNIDNQRSQHWSYDRAAGDERYPYVVRDKRKVVCRVRSHMDALRICAGRTERLREAGERASDLRRFKLQADQMELDIRNLMQILSEMAQVLKLCRPREVVRAREEIRHALIKMRGRGHLG